MKPIKRLLVSITKLRLAKDAEEQIKRDGRLSFIECTDDFLSPLNSLELIHAVHELQNVEVRVKERGVPPTEHPRALEGKGKICRVNGVLVDFLSFLKQQIDRIILQDQKEASAKYHQLEGPCPGELAELIEFEGGEFILENMEVEHMMLTVQFTVTTRSRKVLAKFELKGQGRAFSFEPIEDFLPGKRLEVVVVQRV